MVKIFSYEERLSYLKKYGNFCIAYSTIQPGMQYFDIPQKGYLAYMVQGKKRFVLGDPICAKEDKEVIIKEALKEYPNTVFYQITKETAELLHKKFGFYMNIFGTETFIHKSSMWPKQKETGSVDTTSLERELNSLISKKDEIYPLMGPNPDLRKEFWRIKRDIQDIKREIENTKKIKDKIDSPLIEYLKKPESYHLRRQYSLALDKDLRIFEEKISDKTLSDVNSISKEWVSTRMVSSNEMKFFTRPLTLEFDSKNHARLFTAMDKTGKRIGFLILDPLFSNDKIIGYYADILRIKKNAPKGTAALLLLASIDAIFEEDYEYYTLGLAPFHHMASVHFLKRENKKHARRVDNKLMTFIFNFLFKYGNFIYNAKDQAFHKERFNGKMVHTFCATKSKIPIWDIFGGFLVSGIDPIKQLVSLFKSN
jgi:lysylphosphatidylglycerol synthetase-like protein (DUF2156 family)